MNAMHEQLAAGIKGLLSPILDEQGLELVAIQIRSHNRRYTIEVFVDRPQGGVTIGQCSLVNKILNRRLEEADPIAEDYVVEVCSPGLDWPLSSKQDFRRVISRPVKVSLNAALAGKMEYVGTVQSVEEESVVLLCGDQEIAVPLSSIGRATQFIG